MASPAIIRARRYVSAPAGAYPRPRVIPRARDASVPSQVEDPLEGAPSRSVGPDEDEHGPEPLLMGHTAEGPSSGVVVEDLAFEEPDDDGDLPLLSGPVEEPGPAEEEAPSRSTRGVVILFSGLVGIVLGAMAGLALLAFMEPAQWMERFLDPIGLWTSTADPLIRTSAIMIVVGCGLIGALLPLRLRR